MTLIIIITHKHHDRLICLKCGNFAESSGPNIEKLRESPAKTHNLSIQGQIMEIYGICNRRKTANP